MPLQPVGGKLHMPVETEADVRAIFEKAISLSSEKLGKFSRMQYQRDIQDHFYYIGAICPDYFRPLQEEMVQLPDEQLEFFFSFPFQEWLYLFQNASDACVEHLARKLHEKAYQSSILENMLAAICTPAALEALADYAEKAQKHDDVTNMGFWMPQGAKKAEPRFTRSRKAVQVQLFDENITADDLAKCEHPVGLPVSSVLQNPDQDLITWHYLTLNLATIEGLPQTSFSHIHLVSPPLNGGWTLFCSISQNTLYAQPRLADNTKIDAEEMEAMREQAREYKDFGKGQLVLLPYDNQLIYRNGHTQSTEGVVGDVGGPPIGLEPIPHCTTCGKLMFHVCTVTNNVREYGDGFRNMFLCEGCMLVASQATSWN